MRHFSFTISQTESKEKLEFSRAHSPHAASASISESCNTELQQQHMYLLTRPVVRMSREHMACSEVGAVDRRDQQNVLFVTFVGRANDLKHTEASFCRILQICCAYELLGCLNLEIWQFSCGRQQTKTIALPLTHAHGVISLYHVHGSLVADTHTSTILHETWVKKIITSGLISESINGHINDSKSVSSLSLRSSYWIRENYPYSSKL